MKREELIRTIAQLIATNKTESEIAYEMGFSRRHVQNLISAAVQAGLLPPRPVGRPPRAEDGRNRRRRDRYALRRLAEAFLMPGVAQELLREALAELPGAERAVALAYVTGGTGGGDVVHSVPPAGKGTLSGAAINAVGWYKHSQLRTGIWGVDPKIAREFLNAVTQYKHELKKLLQRRTAIQQNVIKRDPLLAAADLAGGLSEQVLARLKAAEENARQAAKMVATMLLDSNIRTVWPGGGEVGVSLEAWQQEIVELQVKTLEWAKAAEIAEAIEGAEAIWKADAEPPKAENAEDSEAQLVLGEAEQTFIEDQLRGREHPAEATGMPRAERLLGKKVLIM